MMRRVFLGIVIFLLCAGMGVLAQDPIVADLWYPGDIGSYWKYELPPAQKTTATFTKSIEIDGKTYQLIEETVPFFGVINPVTFGYDPFLTFRQEGSDRIWGYGKAANELFEGILTDLLQGRFREAVFRQEIVKTQIISDEWLLLETSNIGHEWTVMQLETTSNVGVRGLYEIGARLHKAKGVQTKAGEFNGFAAEYFTRYTIFNEFGLRIAEQEDPLFIAWLAPGVGIVQVATEEGILGTLAEYHINVASATTPGGKLRYLRRIPNEFVAFERNLSAGMKTEEVKYLQVMLSEEGPEIYPQSQIDGWFVKKTETAVIRFQEKYKDEILTPLGLTNGTGIVGDKTRKKLNDLLSKYRDGIKITGKDRVNVIYDTVNSSYNQFLPVDFPMSLILAIASQETGLDFNFSNELMSLDNGRGIMQITTPDFIGKGSGEISDDMTKCKNLTDDGKACYLYYSNTTKGVEANIKDGMYALKEKYGMASKLEKMGGYEDSSIKITGKEMRWIISTQLYNGRIIFVIEPQFANDLNTGILTEELRDELTIKDPQKRILSENAKLLIIERNNKWQIDDGGKVVYIIKKIGNQLKVYQSLYISSIAEKIRILKDEKLFPNLLDGNILDLANKFDAVARNIEIVKLGSPGELRIYDSDGHVAGFVNNKIVEDIPNSLYDNGSESFIVIFPSNAYRYEVAGTGGGTYDLDIISTQDGKPITFNAIDIPTSAGAVHQYTVDWGALSQGQKGVTVQIDTNGDGTLDSTIIAGDELTSEEYVTITSVTPNGKQLTAWGKLKETKLFQNYPNPFNPETWIPYQLSEDNQVVIWIYDITGNLVKKLDLGQKSAGLYINNDKAVYWNGRNDSGELVVSGVYFYTLHAGSFQDMKKMVIVR